MKSEPEPKPNSMQSPDVPPQTVSAQGGCVMSADRIDTHTTLRARKLSPLSGFDQLDGLTPPSPHVFSLSFLQLEEFYSHCIDCHFIRFLSWFTSHWLPRPSSHLLAGTPPIGAKDAQVLGAGQFTRLALAQLVQLRLQFAYVRGHGSRR